MKVYYGTENFTPLSFAIVTAGSFDGVHYGHQQILQQLNSLKQQFKAQNAETVLLTYHPHPRTVLFPDDNSLQLLTSLEEKIAIAELLGIDHFVVLPFTKEFSQQSSKEFIENILLAKFNTKILVIGYDHKFGKNREGSFAYLKENEEIFGFQVIEIPAQEIDMLTVSSTKIRKALESGNLDLANELLQLPYRLTGKVVKGNQIGRTIGFPTANLALTEKLKLIPDEGIYAVLVSIDKENYQGMLYIGRRSTLGDNLEKTIEVNIFDFNEDIYDKIITLHLVKRLRGEEKFASLEAMQDQLAIDKKQSLEALAVFVR
jgi:riboflavin kinase/FMN adenylyltransferase